MVPNSMRKSLVPDYAIVHVQEADIYGNCRILGPSYQDALLARAAKKTIVTMNALWEPIA